MEATGNWPALHAHLEAHHLGDMQRQMLAEHALREIYVALNRLVGLGHVYHLEEGPASSPEWPKEVYKRGQGARQVACQAELDELGEGWFDSLSAAEQHHGMTVQFAGRGGVWHGNLPAKINPSQGIHTNGNDRRVDPEVRRRIEEFSAEMRARHGAAALDQAGIAEPGEAGRDADAGTSISGAGDVVSGISQDDVQGSLSPNGGGERGSDDEDGE